MILFMFVVSLLNAIRLSLASVSAIVSALALALGSALAQFRNCIIDSRQCI